VQVGQSAIKGNNAIFFAEAGDGQMLLATTPLNKLPVPRMGKTSISTLG